MKLSDLELTVDQAGAFYRLLNREVAAEEMRLAQDDMETAKAELFNRRYEKVCDLARQTARVNGVVEGLGASYVAQAAWSAFIANEGWFSTFDVDDYWSERDDPEFQEGWELAYVEEVELLKKEQSK